MPVSSAGQLHRLQKLAGRPAGVKGRLAQSGALTDAFERSMQAQAKAPPRGVDAYAELASAPSSKPSASRDTVTISLEARRLAQGTPAEPHKGGEPAPSPHPQFHGAAAGQRVLNGAAPQIRAAAEPSPAMAPARQRRSGSWVA